MNRKCLITFLCITFCSKVMFPVNKVEVVGKKGNWQLLVDGQPFYVKGVCFGVTINDKKEEKYYFNLLKDIGVNAIRTWGIDRETQALLDSAEKYGIKVCLGIWLDHNLEYATNKVYKKHLLRYIEKNVEKFKNHSALLMWCVGNEIIFSLKGKEEKHKIAYTGLVEKIVKRIHKIDPNHPVTTASAWTAAWKYHIKYTPSLDIYGINVYGNVPIVYNEWKALNIDKPYLFTEYGNNGDWEVAKDKNDEPIEPTDTEKYNAYLSAWQNHISGHEGDNIGGFAFCLRDSIDYEGIWFNLLASNRKKWSYYAVRKSFTGEEPDNVPPVIVVFSPKKTKVVSGENLEIVLKAKDSDNDPINYSFKICERKTWGNKLKPLKFRKIREDDQKCIFELELPKEAGIYRIYCFVNDNNWNLSVANRTVKVEKKQ
ncbi:MAG: hypothetical protein JW983_06990 [Elusimicrobia bacterium]|nr:hypothetical protein [Elusimicrobiota bacterium]